MNISDISLRNIKLLISILICISLYGAYSYYTMPASEDPRISLRQAVIYTHFPGLPPDKVDKLITVPIASELYNIDTLEEINSSSFFGKSIVKIKLYDYIKNGNDTWGVVARALSKITPLLPPGTQDPIIDTNLSNVPAVVLAITSDKYDIHQMSSISQSISNDINSIHGTKSVDIFGDVKHGIFISYYSSKMEQLGIMPYDIERSLKSQNIIAASGSVKTNQARLWVDVSNDINSIDDIKNIPVSINKSGSYVKLSDISKIEEGAVNNKEGMAFFNGDRAIMLSINKIDNINILRYSPNILNRIDKIKSTLPDGYNLDIFSSQANTVNNEINTVIINGVNALLIISLVVLLFFGLKIGIFAIAAMPIVLLITFAIMNLTNVPIDKISLSTMIIAFGLLIDNVIVVTEEYINSISQKLTLRDAINSIGRNLTIPIATSSITTMLVFLPLMLSDNEVSEYTRSIAIIIIYMLSISFLTALAILPNIYYYCVGYEPLKQSRMQAYLSKVGNAILQKYSQLLQAALRYRGIVLSSVIICSFSVSLMIISVKKEFFPLAKKPTLLVYVEMHTSSSLSNTQQKLKNIFSKLRDSQLFPEIKNFSGYLGMNGPRIITALEPIDHIPNKAFIAINLHSNHNKDHINAKVKKLIKESDKNAKVLIKNVSLGIGDPSVLSIKVKGINKDKVFNISQHITGILEKNSEVSDISNDWGSMTPYIHVEIDKTLANNAGIAPMDIINTLSYYLSDKPISYLHYTGNTVPVIIRATQDSKDSIDKIKTLMIYSPNAKKNVPLMRIAKIVSIKAHNTIKKENLINTITISVKTKNITAESFAKIIKPNLKEVLNTLPDGYDIQFAGIISDAKKGMKALIQKEPICIIGIALLLLWQFKSFRNVIITFLTICPSFSGAIAGLLAFNGTFGFMAALGMYAIIGILANNVILLLDKISSNINENTFNTKIEAITHAASRRFKPILMTSVTTIIGLIPFIISKNELFYSMAATLIGGLSLGTILSLFLVPILYSYFFRINPKRIEMGNEIA